MVLQGVSDMVLQGVRRCYRVLHGVTRCYRMLHGVTWCYTVLESVTGCYIVLQKKSLLFVQFWAAHGFCQKVLNRRIC